MKYRYDSEVHRRRSIRLKGYDYSRPGAYFVTIVVRDRLCLFGDVVDGEMRLNDAGRLVVEAWSWLATRHAYVELDTYVVMPNHLHGIIVLTDEGWRGEGGDEGWGGSDIDGRGGSDIDGRGGSDIDGRGGSDIDGRGGSDIDGRGGSDIDGRGGSRTAPTGSGGGKDRKPLGRLVGAFKTVSTKRINLVRGTPGNVLWQRNYYERVIRNERELFRVREYIVDNPAKWETDMENPDV